MPVEPETYPGTSVYINKLNITDSVLLAEAEAGYTLIRTEQYRDLPSPTSFDLAHLQYIHYQLFQDLYEWAGQLRGYDTRKDASEFTPACEIELHAQRVYSQLRDENYLLELPLKSYLQRLAYYYDITNKLHPFPEGNGRTQRLFIEDLAGLSNYGINWDAVHAWQIRETAIRAFEGDLQPLVWMLEEILLTNSP